MSRGKKLTIAVLLVLTLALAAISTYVALTLNSERTPDVGVSGFGDYATRDLYENITVFFGGKDCDEFLNSNFFTNQTFDNSTVFSFSSIENNLEDFGAYEYLPTSCSYVLQNDNRLNFLVYSYDYDSFIAESREELYSRINVFDQVLDEGTFSNTDYFFGIENDKCVTHFFQLDNEFEYARLEYNVGELDCSTLIEDNKAFSSRISSELNETVETVEYVTKLESI